jgi:hypothetical protein
VLKSAVLWQPWQLLRETRVAFGVDPSTAHDFLHQGRNLSNIRS